MVSSWTDVCLCADVRLCVWLRPGICRSGGCRQKTEVRPQEILPHAWCAPTTAVTGKIGWEIKCVKLLHISTSEVMITAESLFVQQPHLRPCHFYHDMAADTRPAGRQEVSSYIYTTRTQILSKVWLAISSQSERIEEVHRKGAENTSNSCSLIHLQTLQSSPKIKSA